ncbi:MAG: hypothetical protein U9N55_06125, partial [candidate division Zixibacteria bacterium]|nr:hypothetical protein [candidate division Zixibacteria bacterium]
MAKEKKDRNKSKKKNQKKNPKITPIDSLPSRESIENILSLDDIGMSELSNVDKAQEVIYDAWEGKTKRTRVTLAKKALKISPDCADAYNLLAEETANSLEESIEFYREGVKAGERALGEKIFNEGEGIFWGLLETRPYMRARAGLAECLWEDEKFEEAIEHYWDMLRLNPSDNQGLRFILMPHLIELNYDDKAEKLYKQYKDDASAFWKYSKALLDFRRYGDSQRAEKSLKSAYKSNEYVPDYLLGFK